MFYKAILLLLIILKQVFLHAYNYRPKITVIGAGLAGLTSAYRLHKKGFNVDIYEARNRVGGRIFSTVVDGNVVELGGQNIKDGDEAEHMISLINELGLELIESSFSTDREYYDNGIFTSEKEIFSNYYYDPFVLKEQLEKLALKAKNMKDILLCLFEESEPIYKILSAKLSGYEGNRPENLSVSYINTLYHMLLGGGSSAHPYDQILYKQIVIKDGNSLLPEKLTQALAGCVHLNVPLTSVSKNTDGTYMLAFGNGHQVITDILVLAIPAPVFKDITFGQDTIPLEILSSIREIRCGLNAKILVPITCDFGDKGRYLNDHMGIMPDANGTMARFYFGNKSGIFSAETIKEIYLQEKDLLLAGFGSQCVSSLLPVYAQDEHFACYTGPVGYSWPHELYSQGSYAYIAPGQEALLTALTEYEGELVKTLFAPINNKLYFVGEHTSILMDVPRTIEAACESGERIARMIEKSLEN